MARTGKPAARQVESVQRAIAVLNQLGAAHGDLGTNEIARRTGLNVSTVSRLLATLVDGGLVRHIPATGRYRLGIRILQLASVARENLDIRVLARPYLEELTKLTGETATLSMPGRARRADRGLRAERRVGAQCGRDRAQQRGPRHRGGQGVPGLGRPVLPEGELAGYTGRTVTDRAALAVQIDRVRAQGWAQAAGEREAELNAVAAPVCDATGRLVAILGVQGPATRFTQRAMRTAAGAVRERAALIASML